MRVTVVPRKIREDLKPQVPRTVLDMVGAGKWVALFPFLLLPPDHSSITPVPPDSEEIYGYCLTNIRGWEKCPLSLSILWIRKNTIVVDDLDRVLKECEDHLREKFPNEQIELDVRKNIPPFSTIRKLRAKA